MFARSCLSRRAPMVNARHFSLLPLLAFTAMSSGAFSRVQAQVRDARKAPGGIIVPQGNTAQYQLELVSIKADKIWFAGLGDRDAISLTLQVFDGSDSGSTVTVLRKIHNGQTLPLDFQRLFGPRRVVGQLQVNGYLTIAHPQKFENMKAAVKELYEASGAVAETVGSEKKDEDMILVSKVMKKEQVEKLVVDVSAELVKAAGRVACGGANPITISMDNSNTLDLGEINKLAGGTQFKLLSFHKGAQAHSCFRNIVYDPISARIVRK
jgi:hypothetical protein